MPRASIIETRINKCGESQATLDRVGLNVGRNKGSPRTRCGIRSTGGGGSPLRTHLCCAFSRENTGKFVEFRLGTTIDVCVRSGNAIAYMPNSLSIGSGKLLTQNRERNQSSRERDCSEFSPHNGSVARIPVAAKALHSARNEFGNSSRKNRSISRVRSRSARSGPHRLTNIVVRNAGKSLSAPRPSSSMKP